ncbi:MAG: ABC transporter permease subunit, partial [Rhodospirillales bacterium]|nr:ABC transporter permease subunit [Rhodospirillales bacterium]
MKLRPFRLTVLGLSLLIPAALCAVVLFLVLYSGQAIVFNGLRFLTQVNWNLGDLYDDPVVVHGIQVPAGANYGILVFIAGTLASSAIAIVIAVPLAVGASIFLAEIVPSKIRPALSMLVELIAVVPSVVFGLWGIAVLVPFIGHYLSPNGSGYGLLAASIVLALMITPIIASTLLDALLQVPRENRESAFALGATHFEVVM